MAEVEEILGRGPGQGQYPASIIADKLINLRPAPGPVLSDKSLLDWKVGSGRGVKVRMRYGGLEKEKKGEEGRSTPTTRRSEWNGRRRRRPSSGGQEGHRLLHKCGDGHRVRRREVRRWTCTHDTV
jgi:hypothetical protein